MTSRAFNGEIHDGFHRYRLRESDNAVEVVKRKRKHRFGSGYEDSGPWRELTFRLSEQDARAVHDLLDDWLNGLEVE